ncbi:hypothetical protein CsatB_009940 [Cannabis sativa]
MCPECQGKFEEYMELAIGNLNAMMATKIFNDFSKEYEVMLKRAKLLESRSSLLRMSIMNNNNNNKNDEKEMVSGLKADPLGCKELKNEIKLLKEESNTISNWFNEKQKILNDLGNNFAFLSDPKFYEN